LISRDRDGFIPVPQSRHPHPSNMMHHHNRDRDSYGEEYELNGIANRLAKSEERKLLYINLGMLCFLLLLSWYGLYFLLPSRINTAAAFSASAAAYSASGQQQQQVQVESPLKQAAAASSLDQSKDEQIRELQSQLASLQSRLNVQGSATTSATAGGFGSLSVGEPAQKVLNIRRMIKGQAKCGGAEALIPPDTPNSTLLIDVGAYRGEECTYWARQGYNVLSFEATPKKAAAIEAQIKSDATLSAHIKFFSAAVSNVSGEAEFTVMDGEDGSQQDAMAVPWAGGQKVKVPVVTLDEMVDKYYGPHQRIAFLKSDTQGHELQVLQGAKRMLAERRVEMMHIEFSPNLIISNYHNNKEAPQKLLQFLWEYGYRCFDCPEDYGPGDDRPSEYEKYAPSFPAFEHRGADHGGWTDLICF